MRKNEARTGRVHQDEGLGDWQNISFDKRVNKSSLVMLTVPTKFVRQHGDKFQRFVFVQSEVEGHLWTVKVSVSFPNGRPQVCFSRGWNKFVVFNGVVLGDRMTFNLVAKSKFKVSIARSSENSNAQPRFQTLETNLKDDSHTRRPKKFLRRPKDYSKRPPEKLLRRPKEEDSQSWPKKLLRPPCFVDLTEEPEVSGDECNEPVAKDWEAVKAEAVEVHSLFNAAPAAAAASSSLSDSSDMDSHYFEPVQTTVPFFYS